MKKPKNNPLYMRMATNVVAATSASVSTRTLLQQIRDTTLHERRKSGQTIADLNALRDEIDATIAFLKAQRN